MGILKVENWNDREYCYKWFHFSNIPKKQIGLINFLNALILFNALA